MGLDALPAEVILIIINQFILTQGSSVSIPNAIYIQYRKWNPICKIKTLLAFTNSCKYFKSVIEPIIFKNFSMFLDRTRTFRGCSNKQLFSQNCRQLRESPSLINFHDSINFLISWNCVTVPISVLAHVRCLFMCRVRDPDLQIKLWPFPHLIDPKYMPLLREVSLSVKSGCDNNYMPDFQAFAHGIKKYKRRIICDIIMPLTYWDHDITILEDLNIYSHIRSFSVICAKERYLSGSLLALIAQMKSLRRLLIEFNMSLEDSPEVKQNSDQDYDDVDDDGDDIEEEAQDEEDFVEDFEGLDDPGVYDQIGFGVVDSSCNMSNYVGGLAKLKKLEIYGFRYCNSLSSWRTPPFLKHLCVSMGEFSHVTQKLSLNEDTLQHLEVLPSLFRDYVVIPFSNLKSLTLPFDHRDHFDEIVSANPHLVNIAFTNICYELYDLIPIMPDRIKRLELQYCYADTARHGGNSKYSSFEHILIGPELREVYLHMPNLYSFSFQNLINVITSGVCPKLSLLHVSVPPHPNENPFAPRVNGEIKTCRQQRPDPHLLRSHFQPNLNFNLLFKENIDDLSSLLPIGSIMADFCFMLDIYPPRYRKEDYSHVFRLPYSGQDILVLHYVFDIARLRQLLKM